ncbi:MAG: SBBP repeat-containing protein [Bryobacteraceae bacterium]
MKIRIHCLAALLITGLLSAAPVPQQFRLPLVFEQNRGQAPAGVQWMGQGSRYRILLDSEGATFLLPHKSSIGDLSSPRGTRLPRPSQIEYSIVRMKLVGNRPWKHISGIDPTGGVSNYLNDTDLSRNCAISGRGRVPSRGKLSNDLRRHSPACALNDWLTDIPHFARVKVASVYDGIDLIFYENGGGLEYDFVVAPGADPAQIQVAFDGMENMRLDHNTGDLVLSIHGGASLRQLRPKVYQEAENKRVEIAAGYRMAAEGRAAFTLAEYDPGRPLVIDPSVDFTTFFGGTSGDQPAAIAVDSEGNTYVTGGTVSRDFPTTNGSKFEFCKVFSFGGFCGTGPNVFVAKLNAAGTVVFSSYGGVGNGEGIAVDSTGVYVTGQIFPPDIDNIIGFSDNNNGDIFIWRLAPNPRDSYFQILGTDGTDFGSAIALDSHHTPWVAGATYSGSNDSTGDVDIITLAPNGLFLHEYKYASNGEDVAVGIAMDPADHAWITGRTCGEGFPTTDGILHRPAKCAVFVLELENSGVQRMGMILGGVDGNDSGVAIVPNGSNSAYVTGYANSSAFPTTEGAFQTIKASPGPQTFVTQVDSSTFVGRIIHSTLLSADGSTIPYGIENDNAGGVYVAGSTSSVQLPGAPALVPNPTAGFVTKFSFNLSQLLYTKLLGAVVSGLALRRPAAAVPEIYTTGYRYTGGLDFDHLDAFVVKLKEDMPTSSVANLPPQIASPSFTLTWGGSDPASSVATYDVFVSDNGGPFTAFVTATTASSAIFTGLPGHTYGFFSVATNAAGIAEAMKTTPDVVVTIGATPPAVLCTGCYFVSDGGRTTMAFNVSVAGAGSTFSLTSRESTQPVQFVSTTISQISAMGTSATFSGTGNLNGQSGYNFTVTARDGGGTGSGLDTASITIAGPNNFAYSSAGTMVGGDIVVHQ